MLYGSPPPRLLWQPPSLSNAAVEAIEFYESLGPRLDPWQKLGLHIGLGEDEVGDWATPEVVAVVQRQNGKGGLTEARELSGLFLFGEKELVHSAHRMDTAKKAFKRTCELIDGSDDLTRRVKRINKVNSEEAIVLMSGAELSFRTRTESGGRGLTGDYVCLDEAQELTPAQLEALVPIILARPNPQIWYTGTIPKSAEQFLAKLRARAVAKRLGIAYVDWGVEKGADPDSIEVHRIANPAYGIRVSEKTLAIAREALGEEGFARECLGIWPDLAIGAALNPAMWAGLEDPSSKRDGAIAVGVDIAPLRDYASIAVYGLRADGLGHGQLVDYRPGTEWIVPRLVELRDGLDPVAFAMGRGTYESLSTELKSVGITMPEDAAKPKRGDLAVTMAAAMAAACGQIVDAVRQKSFRVVPHPHLTEAVAGARIRQSGEVIAWARQGSDCDISPVVALTVARWAYTSRVDAVDQETEQQEFFASWR